jgi:hypothetical protein
MASRFAPALEMVGARSYIFGAGRAERIEQSVIIQCVGIKPRATECFLAPKA